MSRDPLTFDTRLVPLRRSALSAFPRATRLREGTSLTYTFSASIAELVLVFFFNYLSCIYTQPQSDINVYEK